MDTEFYTVLFWKLAEGVKITLLLLVICGLLGNLLAVPLAFARISRHAWLRKPVHGFILFFRGTPVLVQLYLIYYGLGEVLSQMPTVRYSPMWPYLRSAFGYAVLALTLNTAAYCAEIWRGALQGLPRGQTEAALSLGLHPRQLNRLVLMPQAFRNALPALAGQNILLLKATSLVSTITIFEVMAAANLVRSQTFRVYESLLGAALVYVILTVVLTIGFSAIEHRIGRPYRR
ncbi:amino acid ABC transporter membrane protein 2 (PAAT family) [Hoeflea marina]|uniref:Amino acid ABC transporter membrane protein 2 (PAAT family) n=1 Tax=Hoeflea marina TaxID=274592 RepID=A0A317PPT9_9HYPH|nr:ABC transporter permease subunit [Hoeflea marina]PWW01938.1 amino acid ABC transporter membrane protein 2 (PAAT family) [Hoeflea marina]